MTPIYKTSEAKSGGWAQTRKALQKFEGTLVSAEEGQWGGELIDKNTGKPVPPREFVEIRCIGNVALESTEELSMDISDEFTFRINCSESDNSFWVAAFLASADKAKVLFPDDLMNKRVVWEKVSYGAGQYEKTDFVISKVMENGEVPTPQAQVNVPPAALIDPMEIACNLAVGKTETQFRSAAGLHPAFVGSPLLALIKSGSVSSSLVEQGKLVLVGTGAKAVYQKV